MDQPQKSLLQRRGPVLMAIVLFGLLLRVPTLDVPLLDRNAWRQADTAAVAGNFYESGFRILYPQIDWRGASSGYAESEFQIYPFAVALLYKFFGIHEWLGRLVSLIFFVFSTILLFYLTQSILNYRTAVWTSLFFTIAPLNIHFSRAFMPTSMLVCCSIGSIYFFAEWIDKQKWPLFLTAAVMTALAVLIKPPSLYLGLPLFYAAFRKYRTRLFLEWPIWFFALLVLLPACAWYYHAHQLFLETHLTFGLWGGYSKFGNASYWLNPDFYTGIASRIVRNILTLPGLVLAAIGFLQKGKEENNLPFWWGLSFLVYVLIVAEGHQTHDYYQMPLVPVLSIYAGKGMNYLWGKDFLRDSFLSGMLSPRAALVILFILISIMGVVQAKHFLPFRPERLAFGKRVGELTDKDALLVFGGWRRAPHLQVKYAPQDPIDFYFSHRKGWEITVDQWSLSLIDSLRQQGARYFASYYPAGLEINKDFARGMKDRYDLLEETDRWFIYALDR